MLRRAVLVCLFLPLISRAEPLAVSVTHSGYFLDGADQPIDTPSLTLDFRIYDAATEGALLWNAACAVAVKAGYYAVTLGAPGCGTGLTTDVLPADAARYLEVNVGAIALSPRASLKPAPAAVRALDATRLGGIAATSILDTTTGRILAGALPTGPGGIALLDGGGHLDASTLPPAGLTDAHVAPTAAIASSKIAGLGPFATKATLASADVTTALGYAPFNPANALSLPTNGLSVGTNQLVTTATGVGIGTATPGKALDVVGDIRASGFVYGDGSQLTNLPSGSQWTTSGSNLTYATGNVGIGSASPAARLDVAGGVKIGTATTCGPTNAGTLRYDGTAKMLSYCDGTVWNPLAIVLGTATNPGTSCNALLQAGVGASGTYWLDTDGAGTNPAFQAFCDMATDGGGWTRLWSEADLGTFNASKFNGLTWTAVRWEAGTKWEKFVLPASKTWGTDFGNVGNPNMSSSLQPGGIACSSPLNVSNCGGTTHAAFVLTWGANLSSSPASCPVSSSYYSQITWNRSTCNGTSDGAASYESFTTLPSTFRAYLR